MTADKTKLCGPRDIGVNFLNAEFAEAAELIDKTQFLTKGS